MAALGSRLLGVLERGRSQVLPRAVLWRAWPSEHEMVEMALDVTVFDNGHAVWFVLGVPSNQPELATGDGDYAPDWVLDPDDPQSVWLRAERSDNHPTEVREYTITLMAVEAAGNISAPYDLTAPVDHDQRAKGAGARQRKAVGDSLADRRVRAGVLLRGIAHSVASTARLWRCARRGWTHFVTD